MQVLKRILVAFEPRGAAKQFSDVPDLRLTHEF